MTIIIKVEDLSFRKFYELACGSLDIQIAGTDYILDFNQCQGFSYVYFNGWVTKFKTRRIISVWHCGRLHRTIIDIVTRKYRS
jgi:hypothetical protein